MFGPIKTVGVYVEDQERATRFYIDKLGFEVRRKMPMGPTREWIEIAPKGAETCLVIYPKALMQDWNEKKPSVVFHCPDIDSTIAQLRGGDVVIAMEPSDMPWGKFAVIEDPDGNQIGMTEQAIALTPE